MEREIIEREIELQRENIVVGGMPTDDYYTKEETDTLLEGKANVSDIPDISGLQEKITTTNKLSSDLVDDTNSNNLFVSSTEKTTWNNKQNALTFDSTPTASSTNPVTSEGIKTSIDSKLSKSASYTEDNITYTNSITLNENDIASGIDLKAETDTNDTSAELLLYPDSEYPGARLSVSRNVNNIFTNGYIDTWFDDESNTFETDINAGTITISSNNTQISGVPTPTNNDDVANKKYVDDAIASVGGGGDLPVNILEYTYTTTIVLEDLEKGIYFLKRDTGTPNNRIRLKRSSSHISYLEITDLVEPILYITEDPNTVSNYKEFIYLLNKNTGAVILTSLYYNNDTTYNGLAFSTSTVVSYTTLDSAQTITAKKTFDVLPESSVVPTTNDQLVNKKYVDDCIGTALGGSY